MTIKTLYPNVRPTLDLAFAATKALDPRITFTRASAGTYVGSDGTLRTAGVNEARFDHSPLTLESLGLLVEEQRTNLIVQSENFGTTWTTTGLLAFGSGSTLNATVAPDGATTADLVTENSSTSEHRIETAAISWVANTTYTLTIFAKANGRTRMDFFGVGGGNFTGGRNASFNLSTGAVITTDGAVASIEARANGWYRVRMTLTASAAPSASSLFIRFLDNSNNFSYTGDGTSGLFLWGAQLEAGAFPTSYIPTTTAAATRGADVASITGTAFSGWYRQDEGTVFVEYSNQATAGQDRRIFNTSDATGFTTNGSTLFLSNGTQAAASFNTFAGGLNIGPMHSSTPLVVGVARKAAYSIQVNSRVLVVGGAAPLISSNSYTPPSNIVSADLGQSNGGSHVNGTIRRLTYWPWRLSNATLQALTS